MNRTNGRLQDNDGEGVGTVATGSFEPTDSADDDGTLLFDQGTHRGSRHYAHRTTVEQGSALTRVGAIMGTPLYMSPEQCGGGYVDTRSDIYSLGVIAYQMLAGEPPFAGNTSTVMRAHREQKPQDLRERAKKIPKRVAVVVMSALSKNPGRTSANRFCVCECIARTQRRGRSALSSRFRSLQRVLSEVPQAQFDRTRANDYHQHSADRCVPLVQVLATGRKRRKVVVYSAIGILSLLKFWRLHGGGVASSRE